MTTFYQFDGSIFVPSSWALPDSVGGGDVGKVLTVIDSNAPTFEAQIDNLLLYRNAATTLVSGSPWVPQWSSANTFATIGAAGYAVALRTGVLKWLRVSHSAILAVNELLTYVVVVNGADTALKVDLNVNVHGPVLNNTDTAAVNVGDLISMRCDGLTANRASRAGADFFLD